MPDIFGTAGPDGIVGTADDDSIFGLGANDQLYGREGADLIDGGDGDDLLFGEAGADQLLGGAGDDVLDGGTGAANTLNGGAGHDLYELRAVGDLVSEGLNGGEDTVRVWFGGGYQMPDNVEHLQHIVGSDLSVFGNSSNNTINLHSGNDFVYASSGNDFVSGGGGDDTLWGEHGDDSIDGGSGSDNLVGGLGNDIYYISTTGDTITELQFQGTDSIFVASTSYFDIYTLPNHFENLTLLGGLGGRTAGIGNNVNNIMTGSIEYDELYGRAGNDTLNDGSLRMSESFDGTQIVRSYFMPNGSEVADALFGGAGNDLYFVGALGTSTIENAGEGVDEVRTVQRVYGLQSHIENLTLLDTVTPETRAGVGNELANLIRGTSSIDELFGRAGDDVLYGGMGSANTLFGEAGNDTYFVETEGDSVIEFSGEGFDFVRTALSSFTLRDHVEGLVYAGAGNFIGVGSDATDNFIQSGDGADALNGLGGNDTLFGGSGADLLQGGSGADQFRYLGGETEFDRIIDFVSGTDKIALSSTGFAHTSTVDFISGNAPSATGTNSAFLYDTATGMLSYDADGNGAGAAIQIAQLNAGQVITGGDMIFY